MVGCHNSTTYPNAIIIRVTKIDDGGNSVLFKLQAVVSIIPNAIIKVLSRNFLFGIDHHPILIVK